MTIRINELTLDNLGSWPTSAKTGVIAIASLIILGLGYWFDTQTQVKKLSTVTQQESTLRNSFEKKQQMAANLDNYQSQLQEMKHTYAEMLRKLPRGTEVPGLLEDISKTGVANGLEFKFFKPMPEKQFDFFAELPIQITVTGQYHQLGNFVSDIANLDRIVTLHDFDIEPVTIKNTTKKKSVNQNHPLTIHLIAKTYRYSENQPEENQ